MGTVETWRSVVEYEGLYEVSNYGRVKSLFRYRKGKNGGLTPLKERVLRPKKKKHGYLSVSLSKEGKVRTFLVHRLVVLSFPEICGELFEGAQVNHKNEIKHDNRAENLETCSAKYNSNYGTHKEKLSRALKGKPRSKLAIARSAKSCKKPVASFSNGVMLKQYRSATDAQRENPSLNYVSISAACNGRLKTYKGLEWKFI